MLSHSSSGQISGFSEKPYRKQGLNFVQLLTDNSHYLVFNRHFQKMKWCPIETILRCFKLLSTQYRRQADVCNITQGLILTAGKGTVQELQFSLGCKERLLKNAEMGGETEMLPINNWSKACKHLGLHPQQTAGYFWANIRNPCVRRYFVE